MPTTPTRIAPSAARSLAMPATSDGDLPGTCCASTGRALTESCASYRNLRRKIREQCETVGEPVLCVSGTLQDKSRSARTPKELLLIRVVKCPQRCLIT